MKPVIVCAVLLSTISVAWSQGTIHFSNGYPEIGTDKYTVVNAPVYDVDGITPLSGSGFLAQLYAAPVGGSLSAVGVPITFGSSGYFVSFDDIVVLGTSPGGSAWAQVKAWRASDGATFEQADKTGGHVGASAVITVDSLGGLGGVPMPGAIMSELKSFSLYVVPEPSLFGLSVLTAATFWTWRRLRK